MAKVYDLDRSGARSGGPRTSTEPVDEADWLADREMRAELDEDNEDFFDNDSVLSTAFRNSRRLFHALENGGSTPEGGIGAKGRRRRNRQGERG